MIEKPRSAVALSVLAGLLTLFLGAYSAFTEANYFGITRLLVGLSGTTLLGTATVLTGVWLLRKPEHHVFGGSVVFLLGLASGVSLILVNSEAFFVVPLITIIGGSLGIFWEKSDSQVVPMLRTVSMICFLGGVISLLIEFLYYLFRFSVYPEAIPATAGAIAVVCAVLLYTKSNDHRFWGFLLVVVSVLNLFSPIWLWIVSLLIPFAGGLFALTWDSAPKVSNSLRPRYNKILQLKSSFHPIPSVIFLSLLLLPPVLMVYPGLLPMEKTWSQAFTLNAGENRLIRGSVSAEDIHVSATIQVQNCCNSVYFDVRDYWDLSEEVGGLVNTTLNFNLIVHQVVAYGFYSQQGQFSGSKQIIQLTVEETALIGSGNMLQMFLIFYSGGIGIASGFLALKFAIRYVGTHREKTSPTQQSN